MNNLGSIYYNGKGVPKDLAQSRAWYVKAVAAGYAAASTMIKKIDASKN